MLNRMYATVKFDRPIKIYKHYISPGGYEVKFTNGKTMRFDFEYYEGNRKQGDDTVLEYTQKYPDIDIFEDLGKFDYDDFINYFDGFAEFYIYTGEEGYDEIIYPIKVLSIVLEFYDKKADKFRLFEVPEDKLPKDFAC